MSSEKHDGGPAYPSGPSKMARIGENGIVEPVGFEGMSLRDWFAGMAISGLISQGYDMGEVARLTFATADAMLAERAKAASK